MATVTVQMMRDYIKRHSSDQFAKKGGQDVGQSGHRHLSPVYSEESVKREYDVTSMMFDGFAKNADRFVLIIDNSYIEGWIVDGTLSVHRLKWGPYTHVRFDGYFDKEKTSHPRAVAVFNFMSVYHISLEGKTLKIQIDDKH